MGLTDLQQCRNYRMLLSDGLVAVAFYRENKVSGLIAQGVGTSMLQIPNIVRRPIIWIPAIVSSAILGPVASAVLHMVSTPVGSGMGSAGFVGQIAAFGAMTEAGMSTWMALLQIAIMHFILPALLTLGVSEFMRKKGWIREGDMALKSLIKKKNLVDKKKKICYNKTCAKNTQTVVFAQYTTGGGWCESMSNVIVKENESLDSALRRFKRNCAKAGIQQEIVERAL